MKSRVLLVLVVALLIVSPLTGRALGASQLLGPPSAAESSAIRLVAQAEAMNLPNCVELVVDAASGVRLPPPRSYDMVFHIFDAPRRGHSLWKEEHEDVEVQADRSLRVLLGCSGRPIPVKILDGRPLWVEIQVIIEKPLEPLAPRIPLTREPFAYQSMHADEADHAREADHADTADFAVDAGTADEALHANDADHADRADIADEAGLAKSALYADKAGFADNAGMADDALHAILADDAKRAQGADEAIQATNAVNAVHAETAGYADRAGYADGAAAADDAVHAELADVAKEAAIAGTARQAETADSANYADRSGIADSAATAGSSGNLQCTGCVDEGELSFDPLTQEEFEQAGIHDDLECTACVAEDELSFDPLTQEEFEQGGIHDDLECTACVEEDELAFDPLTQEEFEQAGIRDDLQCTACVAEDELSFDPLTQEEFEQPRLDAALDGFQARGGCMVETTQPECVAPLDEVPEGKILIIEHVSAWVSAMADYEPLVRITVASKAVEPELAEHFVDLELVGGGEPEADTHYWTANHPTLAYAGGSTMPEIHCQVGTDGACSVTVAGRMVEATEASFPFQVTMAGARSEAEYQGPGRLIPLGFMAVIKQISASIYVEDPTDVVHTVGVQIGEDFGELPPESDPRLQPAAPLPEQNIIFVPGPSHGDTEPAADESPGPDPFPGDFVYWLTPSLPASPLFQFRTASEPVLAYVNEGMMLGGICGHVMPTLVECVITVSGYLVELPVEP